METIQIEFQPNVREKLMDFLNTFSKNELHITKDENSVIEDEAFIKHRDRLHAAVKRIESGESKFYSLEELDTYLDNIIAEYEN